MRARHRRAPSLKRDTTGSPRAARTNYPPPPLPREHLPRPAASHRPSPSPDARHRITYLRVLAAWYPAARRTPAMRLRTGFLFIFITASAFRVPPTGYCGQLFNDRTHWAMCSWYTYIVMEFYCFLKSLSISSSFCCLQVCSIVR